MSGSKSEQAQYQFYRPAITYMPEDLTSQANQVLSSYMSMPTSIPISYGGGTYQMGTQYPMYGITGAQQLYSPQPAGGYGTTTQEQGGCNMCFVFAEAERDEMLKEIRKFRDEHFPKTSIVSSGYGKLSRWLIPLMRKHKAIKFMVKFLMTMPLIAFARWYYKKNHYGIIFYPLAWMWKEAWLVIGKHSKAKEYTWTEFYDIVHSS